MQLLTKLIIIDRIIPVGGKKMKRNIIIVLIAICTLFILISCYIYIINKNKIPVLCYHNLATAEEKTNFESEKDWTIDVKNFEEQLKYLKKHNYKTLTMEEFYEWKQGMLNLPQKSVLITFDDGFLSNYHYAFPLLKKYNMNATVFLIGEYVQNATQTGWDGNIKTYMPLELVEKSKEEYPNIDFCSHTYGLHYHNSINEVSKEQMKEDFSVFNNNIANTKFLAYPFGQYNEDLINSWESSDGLLAFAYGPTRKDYRKASRKDDNYKIPRLNVSHGMEIWKLSLRLLFGN